MAKTKTRATKKGQKIRLVLDVKDYAKLMDDLDELEAIRAYDAAKRSRETPIPFDQAIRGIERSNK